jgi:hypothetical protein
MEPKHTVTKVYRFFLGGGAGMDDKISLVMKPEMARHLMKELKKCLLPVFENGKGYTDTFSLTITGFMETCDLDTIEIPFDPAPVKEP